MNDAPIMALSWKAPYAQLMLHGKIETRTWQTNYRGLVLICCSKIGYTIPQLLKIAGENQYNRINRLYPGLIDREDHFGCAIAVGRLVDCREMLPEDEDATFVKYRIPWQEQKISSNNEQKTKTRRLYCHIYQDIVPINPLPFKGGQGWQKLSANQVEKIKDARENYIRDNEFI